MPLAARLVAALMLGLASIGCETPPDLAHPRLFWSEGLTFRYPGNWSVEESVHEEGGIAYRTLYVESPGNAMVIVSSFEPPISMSLEEYAAGFHRALLEEADSFGNVGPVRPFSAEGISSRPTSARIGGVPHEGVEFLYSFAFLGTELPTVLRTFRVETDLSTTFLSAQTSAEDWAQVAAGFQLVLESFEPR